MAKFLKHEVRELRNAISRWWLYNRTPLDSLSERERFIKLATEKLATYRTHISITGIREMRNIATARRGRYQRTAKHAEGNPRIWGSSTAEIITRFEKLSEKETKSIGETNTLIAKVVEHGLPEELNTYLPWND